MAKLAIYKKGQGKHARILTVAGIMLIVVLGAHTLSGTLSVSTATRAPAIRYGVPTLLIIGGALLMYWVVNRPKTADFLIATEGEMKKVSWSSKKEIVGSTKVVIVFTFVMMVVLFAVDTIFALLFRHIGVM